MELEGRLALVTGAGHRVGRAIALALGREGCRVLVHYRSAAEAARSTCEEIRALGRDAKALRADLSRPSEIEDLVGAIEGEFGGLDVLVNSAASFVRQPFEEIRAEDWDAVFDLNLRAPFLLTRRSASLMARAAGRRAAFGGRADAPGAVVNIADLSGLRPWRGYAHHGVSKAALLHLTRAAALELGPRVRVNAVVPGPILPPRDREDDDWPRRGERLPLRRTGEPEEVGHAVAFLATNDFITGQAIVVDGGAALVTGR